MNELKKKKVYAFLQAYADSFLTGLRTAGGLLVGNSVLIEFGVVNAPPEAFMKVLIWGIFLILVSLPVAAFLAINKES
jgi:hypothetical protein